MATTIEVSAALATRVQATTAPARPWSFTSVLIYALLILGALIVIFPFIWMVLGSFKTLQESNRFPPTFWPETWQPQNYLNAWLRPRIPWAATWSTPW